mgnify:CR=1 FL=1
MSGEPNTGKMSQTTAALAEGLEETRRGSALLRFLGRLCREKPLGAVGGVIVLLMLLTGIFADVIAPYSYDEVHPIDRLSEPSSKYLLGTDGLGRDVLSRIIYGARISMIVGLAATALNTVVSTVIGLTSGYIGGKFDLVVQRFVDGFMSFPSLILLMVLMSIIGPGLWPVILVLGISQGIICSRIARGATMSVKENVYVQAAVAIGCSNTRILLRHVLPNIMATVIVMFSCSLTGGDTNVNCAIPFKLVRLFEAEKFPIDA